MSLKHQEYKEKNLQFMDEAREREGMNELENGVLYRIITNGRGIKPTLKSNITVHYKGQLINGEVFDTTFDKGRPATFRLAHLIEGWQSAISEMQVGAHWEIIVPYYLGYGSRSMGDIKAYSTLIFEVQLLGIR